MGLFKHISDMISANLSEMAEGWEDPETMLRQAVREMEQSICAATQDTAKILANEKLLTKELVSNRQQVFDWQAKAEKAIDAGDDGLARRPLVRKQEHQKLAMALEVQLQLAQETTGSLKHQLAGMQIKLGEAKRNLATLSARKKAAEFRKKMHTSALNRVAGSKSDYAFAKFDRLKERVEQAEAEAEALDELRRCATSSEDLDCAPDAPAEEGVDVELALLKRQRKQ